MTAEVVVVNKSAIALAADSAATVSDQDGDGIKTYGANKLFALSKFHPVGVMIYSDTELMGMPWETIFKEYRKELHDKSFPTLREYAEDLFRFIRESPLLFSREARDFYVDVQISFMVNLLKEEATEKVRRFTAKGRRITKKQINLFYEETIRERHESLLKEPILPGLPADFSARVTKDHKGYVKHFQKTQLTDKGIKLTKESARRLVEIAGLMFATGSLNRSTGVVVAGFGEHQAVPYLHAFEVFGLFQDTLIQREDLDKSHPKPKQFDNPYDRHTGVYAFAQDDVVKSLVEGVSGLFRMNVVRTMARGMVEARDEILAGLEPLVVSDRLPDATVIVKDCFLKRLSQFQVEIDEFAKNQEQEVRQVVGFMPKDDLANLASALVELTSVKRKMSLQIETVGGPVDVAVISKGDGLIWISRKHYFKPELNLQFTENYFR